jgi:hypothetical protein
VSIRQPNSTRDDFEVWLTAMDDVIDEFLRGLPEGVRARMDYSPASLDVLEEWLLDTYRSPQALRAGDAALLDRPARYVGETMRRNLGGKWTINLDEPEEVFFGLPILTEVRGAVAPMSPYSLTTATLDRNTGGYLRRVLENINKRNIT